MKKVLQNHFLEQRLQHEYLELDSNQFGDSSTLLLTLYVVRQLI
jgi:hypothetical protein